MAEASDRTSLAYDNQTDNIVATASPCPVGEEAVIPEVPPNFFENFPAPSNGTRYATWEIAIKASACALAMLTCAVGNFVVILIVLLCRRMRSTTNLYVCNLAVSDIMVSLLCMWVHLGANITSDWPFTANMCKVNNFFQAWSVTASVLFLAVIAGDRFFAIVYPLQAKRGRIHVAVSTIVVVWILSAAVAVPHLVTWRLLEIQWKDRLERACIDVWPQYYYVTSGGLCLTHKPTRKIYVTVHIAILYFLPVVVMTCAYVIIARTLWKRKLPGEGSTKSVAAQTRSRKKVVRMMIVVLLVFFVCWTPQQVIVLYDTYRSQDEAYPDWFVRIVKYIVTFIAYCNSAINPILYGALNENFRQGFREAFKCSLCLRRNQINPVITVTSVRPISTQHDVNETQTQRY